MPACVVRYRLDGAGPAVFLVECEEQFHLYTRGSLGAAVPEATVAELVSSRRGGHWMAVPGELVIGGPVVAEQSVSASAAPDATNALRFDPSLGMAGESVAPSA